MRICILSGRARSTIAHLYRWRYKKLGDLSHINDRPAYKKANAGFRFDYQVINVPDFNGVGESEPNPYFYQVCAVVIKPNFECFISGLTWLVLVRFTTTHQ